MTKRDTEISDSGLRPDLLGKGRHRRETLRGRRNACAARAYVRNDLTPNLDLVWLPPADLRPAQRRVRTSDPAHVTRVRNAIETLGFSAPILISAGREIIDGHARWEAAKQLGLASVPCLVVEHPSPEELRVLRIALNRHAERGEWDFDVLRLEFQELIVLGAPLEVSGFEAPEIDVIVLGDDLPEHEVGPLEPQDREPVAQTGDIWGLGDHRIACGDACDPAVCAALLGDDKARLIFTDPPYNVPIAGHVTGGRHREFAMASGEMDRETFARFNAEWMAAALRHLVDGGLVAPFIDWRSIDLMVGVGRGLGLALINVIVWVKDNAGQGALWRSQHELLPVLKQGTAPHLNNIELGRHGRRRSNVWQYPGATSMGSDARKGLKEHPTVKPVALIEDALLDVTARGDIVLDPFLGSGSTAVAAAKTGRICRGIEIDPLYVDVAIRRWIALTGAAPELLRRDGAARSSEPRQSAPLLALPSPDQEA